MYYRVRQKVFSKLFAIFLATARNFSAKLYALIASFHLGLHKSPVAFDTILLL